MGSQLAGPPALARRDSSSDAVKLDFIGVVTLYDADEKLLTGMHVGVLT